MASTEKVESSKDYSRFSSVLLYAILEWSLILLLFLNAVFSYLVTKFARFCKLQTPCLLCSRLDHILGHEKPGFYRDLVCEFHKSEISVIAYCYIDREANGSVDGFNLPNSSHGEDIEEIPLLKKNPDSDHSVTNHCSCCSLLHSKPFKVEVDENDLSLSKHKYHLAGSSDKLEESLCSALINRSGNHDFDHLSRVGYSEVKVTSDSESEVLFSYHEDEDFMDRCLQPEPNTSIANELSGSLSIDTAHEKLIDTASITVESACDVVPLASTVTTKHGLEEIDWSKIEERSNAPAPCETICESDVPKTEENVDVDCFATTSSAHASKALCSNEVMDPCVSVPIHMDLNDAYKLATGNKSNLTSPSVSEVITGRDSFRANEELKLLISQMSAARGLETPWNDLTPSPRLQQGDDFKFSDASSSVILQNITKRISIDRNESGLESLDGSMVSEIEGESVVDRLKRQLELDRKSLHLLYKELEEERCASAIAANQAMAMITKLHEEKAAMHMEALQYQRMMEEQAEYDQEALQKLNELLSEREKHIQDLEADIENYRIDDKFKASKLENVESVNFNEPLPGFEDEKSYISTCLKRLEEKLHLFFNNGDYAYMSGLGIDEDSHLNEAREDDIGQNDRHGQNSDAETATDLEQAHGKIQEQSHMNEWVSTKDSCVSREDSNAKTSTSLSMQGPIKIYHKESLASLQVEVSHLNERLESLEADRNFLEHTINSLRNGDRGMQFIQEIARDLRELRRTSIITREHGVVQAFLFQS